jgi:hypothetical protein
MLSTVKIEKKYKEFVELLAAENILIETWEFSQVLIKIDANGDRVLVGHLDEEGDIDWSPYLLA